MATEIGSKRARAPEVEEEEEEEEVVVVVVVVVLLRLGASASRVGQRAAAAGLENRKKRTARTIETVQFVRARHCSGRTQVGARPGVGR